MSDIISYINEECLAEQQIFQSIVGQKLNALVAIDGVDGTGKSRLFAPMIARIVGAKRVLSLDKFTHKSHGEYSINNKSLELLDSQIQKFRNTNPVIVEGVLIMRYLSMIKMKPTLWVYIKKMVNYGWEERDWLDDEFMKDYPPSNEHLKSLLSDPLRKQLYRYHKQYSPYRSADLVLEVNENYFNI